MQKTQKRLQGIKYSSCKQEKAFAVQNLTEQRQSHTLKPLNCHFRTVATTNTVSKMKFGWFLSQKHRRKELGLSVIESVTLSLFGHVFSVTNTRARLFTTCLSRQAPEQESMPASFPQASKHANTP